MSQLRFRRSFQLFPGVRVNVGKNGISTSFGVPGAHLTVGGRGVSASAGIPGSGLSFTHRFPAGEAGAVDPVPDVYLLPTAMRQISSGGVETLTSSTLEPMLAMIGAAAAQRRKAAGDLETVNADLSQRRAEHKWKSWSIFSWFHRKRIAVLEVDIPELEAEVTDLEGWMAASAVSVAFHADGESARCWGGLVRAFAALAASSSIFDCTASREANMARDRTSVSEYVDRQPVSLSFSGIPLIEFSGQCLRFGNANGEDILLYPGMAFMQRADGAMALISLSEADFQFEQRGMVEDGEVPAGANVVSHVWLKANKDGSPDRRFAGNRQLPVALYGRLAMTSQSGLNEAWLFSSAAAAEAFGAAFRQYKSALAPVRPGDSPA